MGTRTLTTLVTAIGIGVLLFAQYTLGAAVPLFVTIHLDDLFSFVPSLSSSLGLLLSALTLLLTVTVIVGLMIRGPPYYDYEPYEELSEETG